MADQLLDLIKDQGVVDGRVRLSAGKQAESHVDMRPVSLDRAVGAALREPTAGPGPA